MIGRRPAPAKINLALVVGPAAQGGRHEVTTVLQRIDLCDRVSVHAADSLTVTGFADDTIVAAAFRSLAAEADVEPRWAATIDKRIPVAAGLGGGSSDAATALRLANETLPSPFPAGRLHDLAASLGADVPFFLAAGPQLGEADGTRLTPLDLPQDYWVVVLHPHDVAKASTAAVYENFDRRSGADGYDQRRARLVDALERIRRASDLAFLPENDLASSPLAAALRSRGAFRAEVTGAGPALYGLFLHEDDARAAARALRGHGRTWVTVPAWYG